MESIPKIKGFQLTTKLGKSGMATVYLGIQESLNRKVAIKILAPSIFLNRDSASRFIQEAQIVANLNHSNIVQIIQSDMVNNHYYCAMEYLEESLKDWMNRSPSGKMAPDIAIEIIKDILKALDYAHFKGIYHRDIKPENIMFRHDHTPVLVDFGIALLFDSKGIKNDNTLTKSGMSLGTSYYMSPEQIKASHEIDGRSDIYSLGIVFFEMLTGKKPYEADSEVALMLKHIENPAPILPEELALYQPLIDKMLDKNIKKRLSNFTQFEDELKKIGYNFSSLTTILTTDICEESASLNKGNLKTKAKQIIGRYLNLFRKHKD